MPIFATTFLSYGQNDHALAQALAKQLHAQGITAWLDRKDIPMSGHLPEILRTFPQNKRSVTLLLSEAALQSAWAGDALNSILWVLDDVHIFPIYLGEPKALMNRHELLKMRWLDADGQVQQKGVILDENALLALNHDPEKQAQFCIEQGKIAKFYMQVAAFSQAPAVIIELGQSNGDAAKLPAFLRQLDEKYQQAVPVLPLANAVAKAGLSEDTWQTTQNAWQNILEQALGEVSRERDVYINGHSALALGFFLGHVFHRGTGATLFCLNAFQEDECFSNQGQERRVPLTGQAHCQQEKTPLIDKTQKYPRLALVLGTERYADGVWTFAQQQKNYPPVAWIKSSIFNTSGQALAFIGNVVAFLRHHEVKELYLFTSLPFHILPLLAANLVEVVDKVIFVEAQKAAANDPNKAYVHLPMP